MSQLRGTVFKSDLGWCSLAVMPDDTVSRVKFALTDRSSAVAFLASECSISVCQMRHPLVTMIREYALGRMVDFRQINIDTSSRTEFQRKILLACQAIPYGEIVSYGKLGASIGRPKAARAVGGVMANNLCPIVVPCHRVVGANGKLTGFSAGEGIALKRRMLAMEACVVSKR